MSKYLRHFFRTWKQHFAMQLATVVVLTGTFSVISTSFLIHHNLNGILTRWGDSIRMSVFLDDKIESKKDLVSKIKSHQGVESYQYISKKEAAALFKEQVKSYIPNMVVENEFENPLPASYELKFNKDWTNNKFNQLVKFADELAVFSGVEEVSYGQSWVKNYSAVVDKFNSSSIFLILVLLAGSLFVVGNSIRNSVSQRRDEIEILELIGSTAWSIRAPYIVEGFLFGIISSALSIGITFVLYNWQMNMLDLGMGLWAGQNVVEFLSLQAQLGIILQGGLFGVLGSYFCVSKISTGWAALQAES